MRRQFSAFASFHVEFSSLECLQACSVSIAQDDCARGDRDIRILCNALEERPHAYRCSPMSTLLCMRSNNKLERIRMDKVQRTRLTLASLALRRLRPEVRQLTAQLGR